MPSMGTWGDQINVEEKGKKARQTKVDDFSEIPSCSLVIDGVGAGSWAHLLCAHTNWIDVRPPSFRLFPICSSTVLEEVERELILAFVAMSVDVKFGYNIFDEDE
jgi:hypothetical protein